MASGKKQSLIATTEKIEKRLDILRRNRHPNLHFLPDTIDLFRSHNSVMVDGRVKFNPSRGFQRFLVSQGYAIKQVNWIRKVMVSYPNKRIRYLTILPEGFSDYNLLRGELIQMQRTARLGDDYVVVEKSETKDAIQQYISDNFEDTSNCVLVLDEDMEDIEFDSIVKWGLDIFKEIVIMYRNWNKNTIKYLSLLSLSKEDRQKIHIARIPLSINQFTRADLIATILIAVGFKSVSFIDPEIHPAIISKIKYKARKTQRQKLIGGLWVDTEIMDYINQHPAYCDCLGDVSVTRLGVDNCITYHDMEKLTEKYIDITTKPIEKRRVLQLQSMQPMVRKLGIVA